MVYGVHSADTARAGVRLNPSIEALGDEVEWHAKCSVSPHCKPLLHFFEVVTRIVSR